MSDHRRGWTLVSIIFLVFMLTGLFSARNEHKISLRDTRRDHPIVALMDDAKLAFQTRLKKQSKSFSAAVAEYKRRYGRHPPRGFDDWWEFAKKHDFKLVDEFDSINDDLAPFWAFGGEELRQRTYLMGHLPSIDLVRIHDGQVSAVKIDKPWVDQERGHRSIGFRELLEKFQDKLPNMDFAINTKAEGRVLVPWEYLEYPNITSSDMSDVESILDSFTPDWRDQGSVWEAYRRTCPPGSPARQLYSSYRDTRIQNSSALLGDLKRSDDAFTFTKTVDHDYDFCDNPWARYTQGHFFSDWRTIPLLAPVLSPSKARGFADIRIPSHYYQGGTSRYSYGYDTATKGVKEIDDMEVPWDQKSNSIFWRGATTGGGSTPPGFTPTYQRHRFIRMAHDTADHNVTIVHASPSQPDTFISTTIAAKDLNNDIMDVAFVSAVGDYPGGEQALRQVHRFAPSVPLGKHWSYKYLIDIDGMSYSARFMAFLASDSAVLKSTVYKEFFSDWLQPWLHYIPVSSSYAEIYNIHAYFSGPSASTMDAANVTVARMDEWEARKAERDAQLRQIARAGKQWKQTMGRVVDLEVYVYRLCLEYARLWADDRDAMSFVL